MNIVTSVYTFKQYLRLDLTNLRSSYEYIQDTVGVQDPDVPAPGQRDGV